MALTQFQRTVCRLLAERRIASGESYLGGAAALNELMRAPRISRDLDLFHDTEEAVERSWEADRDLLEREGLEVRVLRRRPAFVQAQVASGSDIVLADWVRDSAYRFFPLLEHEELGLVLHPFDLATNKVLAMISRLEARDWVDVIEADRRLQPLGYLAWAACGKDPGFSPRAVLEHAARTGRYSREEVESLVFETDPPDAGELARSWREALEGAHRVVSALSGAEAGTAVLGHDLTPFRGDEAQLEAARQAGEISFHRGRIGGALPTVRAR